jgi:2-iminobutanoate/2-iminopropanoate deaminase
VGETIEEQTRQTLKNIELILAENGLTFNDVIKTQIFLKDAKDFAVVNTFYMEAFNGAVKPVRTTVITSLPKNA